MANLEFCNKHNMVAYLKKPSGSEGFQEIVDFLNGSYIRYALTKNPTIYVSLIEKFWQTATVRTVDNGEQEITATVDGKEFTVTEASVRRHLQLADVDGISVLPTTKIFDQLSLMGYVLTDDKLTFQKGDRPRRQDTTLGVQMLRLGLGLYLKHPVTHLSQKLTHLDCRKTGNTPGSNKGRMELIQELMETCTSLTKRVLALEEAKTALDGVIAILKLRVKRLERKRKARTPQPMKRRLFKGRVETSTDKSLGEDASKQGRNDDKTEELNLIDGADTEVIMEDKGSGEKVVVFAATPYTPPTTTTIFGDEDLTIAQTLMKMRKLAQRLHEEELAELDRAQKERQKQEEATSAALAEEFDEIQARIDADHELAKQLHMKRAEAIRNKPPTRTQVRNRMITYLKHMGKYTHQQLKHKNFEEVQKLYEREKKWIDDFKPIDDDSQQQAESTKKRPRADSKEESSKKQKLEEDNDAEKEELRDSMDVVPRDDVAIDVESLATKYPIVDWKTHILNENMMYYQIIRANGSSKNYKIFSEMLDGFDRQDVIDLHRLVNERYEITSPEGYDLLLWGDMKTLIEPNEEDEIWKNQQDYNLISW
ncbi:hypothetical protein Tco_1163509 [Tanacetum coccineum]